MGDEDLSAKLKAAAEKKVGGKALTSKFGLDCFALVDKLLRSLGAETAADGDVPVTATADYDWGDGILLDSIQPGDILQFRKHVVHSETWTFANNKWYETETRTLTRPHHTAIVVDVGKDGSVTVVEQNVHPNPKKVTRNVIPRLDAGEETRKVSSDVKIKLKVTGSVKAYRAVPKPPKGASLLRPGQSTPANGWRMMAYVVPSQGGGKRVPGPLGMEVPTASKSPDSIEPRWPDDDRPA
jgi:hypothetical protein